MQTKLTIEQQVNIHLDALPQATICELIGLLGAITHHEWLDTPSDKIKQNVYRKIGVNEPAKEWIIKTFLSKKSTRPVIIDALISRWNYVK